MTSFLIVRLGALGDVVHTIPVVPALLRRWPGARVDWLIDPLYADVVRMVRGLGRAIPFDPRQLLVSEGRGDTLATVGALRDERYDAVLDLQGLVKSASVARIAGGGKTIGFAKDHLREPAARFFYSDLVELPAGLHILEKNLGLLSAVDVQPAEPEFPLDVPDFRLPRDLATQLDPQYVVINPGAAWPNKRWPAERFGEIARRISESWQLRTLVVWGPDEHDLAHAIAATSGGGAHVAPETTVVQLFGLFRAARLVIAGDTGPLHIASSVGTPVVALFGPTDPARNGPWRADDVAVSVYDRCGCQWERQCKRATQCLDGVSVDDVMQAVEARLRGVARARK